MNVPLFQLGVVERALAHFFQLAPLCKRDFLQLLAAVKCRVSNDSHARRNYYPCKPSILKAVVVDLLESFGQLDVSEFFAPAEGVHV